MRDGTALVAHVRQVGLNVIAHVGGGTELLAVGDLLGGEQFSFVEQLELLQCMDTLRQVALHVTDEPAASAAALPALKRLQQAAGDSGAAHVWRQRRDAAGAVRPDPWVEAALVSALAGTIIASVRERNVAAGRAAAFLLLELGADLADLPAPDDADQAVMDTILAAFGDAFASTVDEREFSLRSHIVTSLSALLERLADPRTRAGRRPRTAAEIHPLPNLWTGYLREQSRRFTSELLLPGLLEDDLDATRVALGLGESLSRAQLAAGDQSGAYGTDEARLRMVEAVFELAAQALASGGDRTAHALVRWLDETDRGSGMEGRILAANSRIEEAAAQGYAPRPSAVTTNDRRTVLVLVTALGVSRYGPKLIAAAGAALARLDPARVAQYIDRLSARGDLSEPERRRWRLALARLS
jgi:hypothetical protein